MKRSLLSTFCPEEGSFHFTTAKLQPHKSCSQVKFRNLPKNLFQLDFHKRWRCSFNLPNYFVSIAMFRVSTWLLEQVLVLICVYWHYKKWERWQCFSDWRGRSCDGFRRQVLLKQFSSRKTVFLSIQMRRWWTSIWNRVIKTEHCSGNNVWSIEYTSFQVLHSSGRCRHLWSWNWDLDGT